MSEQLRDIKEKAFDLRFETEIAIVGENWFRSYHERIAYKFPSFEIIQHQARKLAADQTFIYLMKDFRSGYYKIGHSRNPRYRESTLQSEQPLVELIIAWLGKPRNEADIHAEFKDRRVRGEWFNLTESDLQFLFLWFAPYEIYGQGMSFLTHYQFLQIAHEQGA